MKRLIVFFLTASIVSCNGPSGRQSPEVELADNEELKALYAADQADRQAENIDWSVVTERDNTRLARVYELLDSNKVRTSADYANAAMIFQHGSDTIASGMAVKMMRKAIELDSSRNKWLLAAAIDRDLMRRGKPQIYGTQYVRSGAEEPWRLYDLDTTQITDEARRAFGVETLAEQREKLRRMNKKKLTQLLNEGKRMDEIIQLIRNADPGDSDYDLSESGINSFGYQLMRQGREEEALKIFKLNTELYPDGFNTFDSYGECLLKLGRVREGIAAYEKSLELNPNNENARQVLAELEQQ